MKNSISDSFNFESMNSDMLAEINSTISVSSTKDRQYKDLSDDVLIAMAISTGVKSSKELTQCLDNSFLSVLYEKDLMKKMFANKYVFGKRNYYNNLDEGKLLSIAYDLVEKNKLTKLTDIKSMDLPLYLCLLKKKLNSAVAKKYNFQFRSPKKNIKNYDAFSDDELFEKISAANIKTSTDLIKYDNKLYQELINRPSLRNRVILLGWRRKPQIWSSLSTDDWIKICSTFNSSIDFLSNYAVAYNNLCHLNKWNEIHAKMVENGKWSGIYGLDGIRYQSIAEMIVGNWLFISNIFYIPHAPLPFKSSRRFRESDFGLENNEFIEVFLCSELSVAERGDMPSWVNNYQFKRQYKLDSAQKCGIKIITIEAEIYRLHGYKKYISHIKDVLSAHNYHLVDLHNRRLDISGKARGFNWNIDDFINYARNNNLKKLSDFVKVPHSDLYKILIDKNFRDDVRFELDKIYNRKTEAEGKFLVPIEIVKTTCIKLGITQRLEYEDAYKNNLLPFGFPYSVRQSYGINWDVFISGRSRSDFMEFIKAREYVRSRKFKSKSEFTFHVQTDPSMKYIRKNPAAPSGGYPEFVSWPDFLGKTQ